MFHHCPSCSTRLDPSSLHLDQGTGMVRCPACAYDWLEGKAIELSAEPVRPTILPGEVSGTADPDIRQLVAASRQAQETFLLRRKRKRAVAAAWLGLGLAAVSPVLVALAFPEKVVSAMPAAMAFYDWLGRDVNIYGLKIRQVDIQHLMVNGQKVIAIKGELVNVSDRDRKIPWLRFGLKSGDNSEVYQWQLDTASRPLRPGEAKGFVTRVAAPPETASSVEIRFARANEIGSNASP